MSDLTVNKILTDGKEQRIRLESLTQQITNRLQALLPSNYFIDIPSASHACHFRTLAREYAVMRAFALDVLKDNYFREVRPQFLVRNLGYLVDFYSVKTSFSVEKYRSFLLALVKVYFGGSTPLNIKNGVELFTEAPVNIIELYKFEQKDILGQGSQLNNIISVLTGDGRECFRVFTLNSPLKIDRAKISLLDTFKWRIEINKTNETTAFELVREDAGIVSTSISDPDIQTFVRIAKPAHTLFEIRNVLEESMPNIEDEGPSMINNILHEDLFGRICVFSLNNPGIDYVDVPSIGCDGKPSPFVITQEDVPPSLLNDGSCQEIPFGYKFCCLLLAEPPISDQIIFDLNVIVDESKCGDYLTLNDNTTVLNELCNPLLAPDPLNNIVDDLVLFEIV